MTPRVKLEVLDINITLEKAIKHYLTHTHSRIPVYEKTIDNIDYFIASRDLIREVNLGNLHKKLSDLKLRTVLKVPRNQSVSVLLDSLQKAHKTLAVVMDEYG
jgi:CBS domain containing-hemolysin-like protein